MCKINALSTSRQQTYMCTHVLPISQLYVDEIYTPMRKYATCLDMLKACVYVYVRLFPLRWFEPLTNRVTNNSKDAPVTFHLSTFTRKHKADYVNGNSLAGNI